MKKKLKSSVERRGCSGNLSRQVPRIKMVVQKH